MKNTNETGSTRGRAAAAARDTRAIEEIDPDTLIIRLAAWKTVAVDVRETGHAPLPFIVDAISIPLPELAASVGGLPLQTSLSLVCETGAESTRAASILWDLGYKNLAILKGGLVRFLQRDAPV